jgi:hypothetical protein
VSVVTDQDHLTRLARITANFHVYLGHEWTGRIENREAAPIGLVLDGLRDAVGRENDRGTIGNLLELLDEYRPHRSQPLDDMTVMDDFVPHMDGRTEKRDGTLDDVDGPVDAGTEPPRIGKQDIHRLRLQSANAS